MKADFSFLGKLEDKDKIMLSRLVQAAEQASDKYVSKFTFFLDGRQRMLCEKVLKSICFEDYRFFGGYENAERTVLGVFPPYTEASNEAFPIKALTFTYRRADKLRHGDFLGCIMSQGVARETVGDILVSDGGAAVFVYASVAHELESISKIGRVGVRLSEGYDENLVPVTEFERIDAVVSSLRLDCVVGAALRLSREKANALIKSAGAEVDYMTIGEPDFKIRQGSVFSIRGYGKYLHREVGEPTKKERIHITIQKYI